MTQELNQELNKANLTQAIIVGLQGQAEVLLAEKITSKADYEAVDRFRKDVKNYRLAGEKIFEHEISERNRLHKEAIAKKKDVLAPIVDVENKAKARVFEWEYEQEQKAKQAEEDRLRAIEERKTALMELGYMLKEGVWTLEAMSVDAEEVLKASYEKWTNLFRSLRMHGEEVAAAKAEAIRLQEEEAARLLKEKQELEAREAALKEATDRMMLVLEESRKNELLALGCTEWEQDNGSGTRKYIGVRYTGPSGSVTIYPFTLSELRTETQWDDVIKDVRHALGELKQHEDAEAARQAEQAAARARQELIDARVARLKEAGWFHVETDHGVAVSLSIAIGNSTKWEEYLAEEIATWHEDNFMELVNNGIDELSRRQAANEEVIRQQERDRIAKEAADKAEAERLATEQRVAMDGDKELVRQCLLVVQNAGTKLKEIAPQVNTAAVKDKVEQTMEMLRNCYVELNKLQQ